MAPMDPATATLLDHFFDGDSADRNAAFHRLIAATDSPVEWTYQAWDRAVAGLSDQNNHVRAASAQLLCNLAKSDPELRILDDFDALLDVTRDPRFVTARHCLQNLWKIGAAGEKQLAILMRGLRLRYAQSAVEKNGTLIRFDILVGLARIYESVPAQWSTNASVRETALAWIDEEPDPRYSKKYAAVWKKLSG